MLPPPPLKPDAASNFQPLNALGDSCSSPILEPDRSALLQEALADSQLQAVKAQLEARGLSINIDEAQAVRLVGGEQLLIPFGENAHLVWTRANGQTAAVGLVRQGNKTVNITATGEERVVRLLPAPKVEKLLGKLRQKSKFQEFEGKLAQKGKRVGKVRVLFDETDKIAILGIAAEGSEKIVHQVRIKVKADRDDEPEDDAEPVIQATACGQALGEAVPLGVKLQAQALSTADGGSLLGSYTILEGGDYGPQICTSQWGYDYLCLSRSPQLAVSTTSLTLPQTFITQQSQGSFVIWNYGGGTLTGTVSAPAPFSVVSGGSFSLGPGQPQEVVIRFSSASAGSFSQSISISSNGGNKTIAVSGTTWASHFLGELQQEDGDTLRVGMLDSTDAFRTGVFFEPLSSQPLYFWIQFNRIQQELLITLTSRQGERLQGRVRILQAPSGEVNCPALLPSDFEDQQRVLAVYHCLFDAGLRIEIQLQFKDYSVTLPPTRLTSESDYTAALEAMREIARRISSFSTEILENFKAIFMKNETVQALGQCVYRQVTQPSAAPMIPLGGDCSRIDRCFDCLGGIVAVGAGWVGYFLAANPATSLAGVYAAIASLFASSAWGWKTIGQTCPDCVRGCGNPPPPPPPSGGGGCTCSYR